MLEAINLSYSYPRPRLPSPTRPGRETEAEDLPQALNQVGFQLPRGQIVGLLGENGAGKTTLLRCLAGLLKPHTGQVLLDGHRGNAIHYAMSFISGEGSVLGRLTPLEFGEFLGEFYPHFLHDRYQKLLTFFNLPDQPVSRLSKGQQIKAELAAGFCKGVDYILMDEPFTGSDPFARQDFLKIMAGSLRENETILISTHHIHEIETLIDRALILHKGRLVRDVNLDDLHEQGTSLIGLLRDVTGYDERRVLTIFSDLA